jgi:nicotinate phosphoribosyltransferase
MIFSIENPLTGKVTMVDPYDFTRNRSFPESMAYEDLLVPVFKNGELVYTLPSIHETRKRVQEQLSHFHKGIKRFVNPHTYPVGLEKELFEMKTELIVKLRSRE